MEELQTLNLRYLMGPSLGGLIEWSAPECDSVNRAT